MSPTSFTNSAGTVSTVIEVIRQDHLAIDCQEDNGVMTGTDFFIIKWAYASGAGTTAWAHPRACRGCNDGTNILPSRGSINALDSGLYAKRVEIRACDQNCRDKFQARVEWSDELTGLLSPLSDPYQIDWDFAETGEEPYFLDNTPNTSGMVWPLGANGPKPVVNSAGDKFQDYLQRAAGALGLNFSYNIAPTAWNPNVPISYYRTYNSDTFTVDGVSISPNQARFAGMTCSAVQQRNGVQFRTVKIILKFRASWDDVVDDRGFNKLVTVGGNTVLKAISMGAAPGTRPDQPWPLNGSGLQMPNATDAPYQIHFKPYTPMAFAPLIP